MTVASSTHLTLVPDLVSTSGDEPCHIYCCNPDIAFCGRDISGESEVEEIHDDETCLECLVAEQSPCPFCGSLPND